MSNGTGYEWMNMILIELLVYMITDLPWLIQGHLSQEQIIKFFQDNVNKSSTQRFQVKQVGHLLLGMIQEEGQ